MIITYYPYFKFNFLKWTPYSQLDIVESNRVNLTEEWRLSMREFNPNIFKRLLNLPFKLNSNQNNCLNLHTGIYIHSQFLQFMKYKFMRRVSKTRQAVWLADQSNVPFLKTFLSGKFGVKASKKIGRSWSSMMSKSDLCEMAISFCENSMRTLHEIYKAMKKDGFDSELRNLLFVIIGRAHRTAVCSRLRGRVNWFETFSGTVHGALIKAG